MSANESSKTLDEMVGRLQPLNFKTLKAVQPLLVKLNAAQLASANSNDAVPSIEVMDAIVDIVHMSLSSQSPDLSREFVEENLNMANAEVTMSRIFSAAGVKPAGEAQAVR
jgi:hypothetical protein